MIPRLYIACGLSLLSVSALAVDGPGFKFSGFGTVGAVVTNTDDVEFRDGFRQPRGATKSVDFGVDSRVAVQGNFQYNEMFSATAQILASRRMTGDGPLVEWLYGQASTPYGVSLKVGRMVMPTYLLSDSRTVGYSQHWLRAPNEVYGWFPASSFDGVQAQYQGTFGSFNLTAQLSAGKAEAKLTAFGIKGVLDLPKFRSVNVLVENGNWLARWGTTVIPDIEFVGVSPPTRETYSGAGLQYDNGTALVMAEAVKRRQTGGGAFDSDAYYVSTGWRFGAFMPYFTYSHIRFVVQPGEPTNFTSAVGLRWDVIRNVALKAQLERTLPTIGNTVNATPEYSANPHKINVLSVSADFAF